MTLRDWSEKTPTHCDVVVIEQSQMAENGEKVVVRINQQEVTLKTLRLDQDGVKLIPANSTMSPIILNNADVEVLGIVRGVIRDRV
ncbi:MAG: LexA family protein [Litorivicinaceae bacterium]